MPTLFRLIVVFGALFACGYATLYAMANFMVPQPRPIVEAIALPHTFELRTGRSAAETLNDQAEALARHRKSVAR